MAGGRVSRHRRDPRFCTPDSPASTQEQSQQAPDLYVADSGALLDATQQTPIPSPRSTAGLPHPVAAATQPEPAELVRPQEADAARPVQPFGIPKSVLGPMTPEPQGQPEMEPNATSAANSGGGEQPPNGGDGARAEEQVQSCASWWHACKVFAAGFWTQAGYTSSS